MRATGPAAINTDHERVDAVVETLASMERHGESLEELAHDARNMVTALSLYCDLLEEPGVLTAPHRHYAGELRLVAEASRRLVEKVSLLDGRELPVPISSRQGRLFAEAPQHPGAIDDLQEELLACRNLLAAIAGPAVRLTVTANEGALPVAMTGENLVRVLVNLVRNAADAIHGLGTIELALNERRDGAGIVRFLVLTLEDSGHGIPASSLDRVFEPGFTTHVLPAGRHRGLGLSITRSIVEQAGGRVEAGNRPSGGARFVIELPVRDARDARPWIGEAAKGNA